MGAERAGGRRLSPASIRRIEQATSRLATQSVARMDEQLPWFRRLPSDQRSWVTLVAQAGLQSYVEWLRSPGRDAPRLSGDVFAAAPQAMANSVTLQQTVELVRLTIAVAEEHLPLLAGPEDVDILREELLRFSREVAFAAARVYATAAETRGTWDRRLEALVIDNLVSGTVVGDPLPSQLAALGWHAGPIAAVVGTATRGEAEHALAAAHARLRHLGLDAMAGVHGERLVIVVGGVTDPLATGRDLLPAFGDGPVVVSPPAAAIEDAVHVTQAALAAWRAAPAWPRAPRPVLADQLLPERAVAGDAAARAQLVEEVYRPLAAAGGGLVETVTSFLDAGGGLEATARALFVHANTVRYRLRRVADVCGESPTDARGGLTLQLALMLGRLDAGRPDTVS